VSRQGACRWFHAGVLPVPARQLATGTILAGEPSAGRAGVALYARVSSGDQRADLGRQVVRLTVQATSDGLASAKVVAEVGSGLNGHRTKLLGLRKDPEVTMIVVEHRDRLARFGVEYLEAALAAQGRRVVVAGDGEVADDLVRDMVEVLTGFCARLYGRRSARRRAAVAVEAAGRAV
jgi:putative resolvase